MARFENGIALVIGIGEYVGEGFTSPLSAATDAAAVARMLKDPERCGYPPGAVTLLTGKSTTRYHILAELRRLSEQATTTSTVLIYFAGHVGQIHLGASTYAYLCPRAADIHDLGNTAIVGDIFREALKQIGAGRLFVVLDCCYQPVFTATKSTGTSAPFWTTGLSAGAASELLSGSGQALLVASARGQPGNVHARSQESFFAHGFLTALDGSLTETATSFIGARDLVQYLIGRTQDQPEQCQILYTGDLDDNFPLAIFRGGTRQAALEFDSAPTTVPLSPKGDTQDITRVSEAAQGDTPVDHRIEFGAKGAGAVDKPKRTKQLQRRIEAAIPAQMQVERETILFVQVRLPEAPSLSPEDWPRPVRPENLESAAENVRLAFPVRPRSNELSEVELIVRLSGDSFAIPNPERRLFVPPDDDSQRVHFLVTPKREGGAVLSIDVLSTDQRSLASLPLGTDVIAEAVSVPQLRIANLVLNVSVAPESPTGSPQPSAVPMPASGYLNVDLVIERRDDTYWAQLSMVHQNGQILVQLSHWTAIAFDMAKLREAKLDMDSYGRLLTELIFASEKMRSGWLRGRAYADGSKKGLRLHLILDMNDAALHGMRWEGLLAPDTGSALAADERVLFARTIFSDNLAPIERPPKSNLLTTAVVAAPNNAEIYGLSSIDAVDEVSRARAVFGASLKAVIARHIGAASVRAALPNICDGLRIAPHILYLVAHGQIKDKEPFLCLEGDDGNALWVSGKVFFQHLMSLPQRPLLIILGSCQSAGDDHEQFLESLGAQFAHAGIPAVIGFQGNVTQQVLTQFLPPFMREIQRDGLVDRALAVARKHISSYDWWRIVLWLRTRDGSIWRLS